MQASHTKKSIHVQNKLVLSTVCPLMCTHKYITCYIFLQVRQTLKKWLVRNVINKSSYLSEHFSEFTRSTVSCTALLYNMHVVCVRHYTCDCLSWTFPFPMLVGPNISLTHTWIHNTKNVLHSWIGLQAKHCISAAMGSLLPEEYLTPVQHVG